MVLVVIMCYLKQSDANFVPKRIKSNLVDEIIRSVVCVYSDSKIDSLFFQQP